ncbi:hypothetical protein EUGRSUZ_C02101 [Eucalyptus grandis]|uniref:Uncharacterized protein n=3 Tax=Eucalyptus grandis TaxID=71139 RepID=A0ACC3LEJ6_EUCGR|nr:hypothetical protein EUGRSUZ_C02101 [Eucalyptus grandis]
MNSKAFACLFFAVFIFSSSAASAFNITKLLSRYPDFSTFNDFLTQTKLYEQINRRQTITVLALDNSAVGDISGKPADVLKSILSAHVVLDYYDIEKLTDLSKKSTLLTTLYQSSGTAQNQQGFLNVTKQSGEIVFGSAVKGASHNAKLVKAVAAQPYNISVLQVSSPIIAPGIDASNPNGTVHNATTPSASPAATPKKAPASSPAKSPVADTPDSSEAPAADSPADAPEADAPEASAPEADAPTSSPPAPSDADADAPAPGKSSSSRVTLPVGAGIVMGLLSAMVA